MLLLAAASLSETDCKPEAKGLSWLEVRRL
jgi:hypothetical protein